MTIEPPVALNKSTVGSAEKMCPEGVAACPSFQFNMPTQLQQTTGFSPGPETPDQYMPDAGFVVSSPSSALMYEQDVVSDMQKSLLSPCSNKTGVSDNLTSPALRNLIQGAPDTTDDSHLHGEDFEQSFNLESLVNDAGLNLAIKMEPSWGPSLPIDTGQKFKAEDVMTSNNINQLPTLAQLNDTADPFEDIDSIIRNDPINKPATVTPTNQEVAAKIPQSPISAPTPDQPEAPKYPSVRNPRLAATVVTSATTPHVNLTISVPPSKERQATCTITSPAQEVPMQIAGSPPYGNAKVQQKPVFNYLFAPTQIPPAMVGSPAVPSLPGRSPEYPVFSVGQQLFMPTTLSTVDQSSLQQLIHAASVKTEPTSPSHKELVRPELHPTSPTTTTAGKIPASSPAVMLEELKSGERGEVVAAPRPNSPGDSDSSGSTTSLNQKWEEIKRYLETSEENKTVGGNSEPPVKKPKLEKDAAYNPAEEEPGCDQDFNSDSDSDVDLDLSDTESVGHSTFVEELLVGGKKEKRYFWQYNTQSKGPKGKRLCRSVNPSDPHVLNTFEDPVFDPDVNDAKYKHTGRARKGDGNDITPSPSKLYQIGNQLSRLNRKINEMAPPCELPVTTRNKTRREKNKYASRACRLKKKAQHEANKIKLYGLDTEHAQLMTVLELIKGELVQRVEHGAYSNEKMTARLERLMQMHLTAMIAGNTADYVNSVLERVVAGDSTGGIVTKLRQ